MKTMFFGSDILSDYVYDVSHVPYYIEKECEELPMLISDEISKSVELAASRTLAKLRLALGSSLYASKNVDIIGSMSEQLSWNELIHTSYFDNLNFVNYMVGGIFKITEIHKRSIN